MYSSFWFDTTTWDKQLSISKGVMYSFKRIKLHPLSEDLLTFSNSVDPDEMQHYNAFHLGPNCLQKYICTPLGENS